MLFLGGFVFYGVWNMIKWFLDPVTQAKVQPMLALSGVQQYIDDEFIPRDMVRVNPLQAFSRRLDSNSVFF